jgi:hypothetical protein
LPTPTERQFQKKGKFFPGLLAKETVRSRPGGRKRLAIQLLERESGFSRNRHGNCVCFARVFGALCPGLRVAGWDRKKGSDQEAEPFKGWANITVLNTGTEDWGDFHFEIFETSGGSVEDVDFIVDAPYEPFSPTRPGLT